MAQRIAFDFEEIHFTESFLAAPEWRGDEMVVAARGLYLVGDRPPADPQRPRSGLLIFGDVARSTRTVYEYEADPSVGHFHPGYVVEDGGSGEDGEELTHYRFGGVLEAPHAWLEWTIFARYFELELDEA